MSIVLIVDDDPDVHVILPRVIRRSFDSSIDVQCAKSAEEGLNYFGQSTLPDLAFVDTEMPIMNGYDVCQRVREKKIHTPVYGMSNSSERDQYIRLWQNAGAAGFIPKNVLYGQCDEQTMIQFMRQLNLTGKNVLEGLLSLYLAKN
ncbi:response regulator [Candidatus Woesearchaeota archaeon]|nr:response regulator [Candidatus Woesearchaeota archaeon]